MLSPHGALRNRFSGLSLRRRVLEHGDERHLPRLLPLRHLQGVEAQPRILVSCIMIQERLQNFFLSEGGEEMEGWKSHVQNWRYGTSFPLFFLSWYAKWGHDVKGAKGRNPAKNSHAVT